MNLTFLRRQMTPDVAQETPLNVDRLQSKISDSLPRQSTLVNTLSTVPSLNESAFTATAPK